jgi:hypothetical protein
MIFYRWSGEETDLIVHPKTRLEVHSAATSSPERPGMNQQ